MKPDIEFDMAKALGLIKKIGRFVDFHVEILLIKGIYANKSIVPN